MTTGAETPTGPRRLAVLPSDDFGRFAAVHEGRLPYRIDLLGSFGYEPIWIDQHVHGPPANSWRRQLFLPRRRWQRGGPWRRTWHMRAARRRADVTLAMFESEGHPAALLRSFVPRRLRRGRLVIVSCWLGELVRTASRPKRLLYRWTYRGVDLVTVFSDNQLAILEEALHLPAARVVAIPFGVDVDELARLDVSEDDSVFAVGRDLGRDWKTFLGAVDGTGWTVRLATRTHQLDGFIVPAEVDVVGPIARDEYLRRLAGATVVVIATHELAYPTGQSVMLEAMALGKACVVTQTAAMIGYIEPGVTCLGVAPGDAGGLRAAIQRLLDDSALRRSLGAAARRRVHHEFSTATMWSLVSTELDRLLDGDRVVKP